MYNAQLHRFISTQRFLFHTKINLLLTPKPSFVLNNPRGVVFDIMQFFMDGSATIMSIGYVENLLQTAALSLRTLFYYSRAFLFDWFKKELAAIIHSNYYYHT